MKGSEVFDISGGLQVSKNASGKEDQGDSYRRLLLDNGSPENKSDEGISAAGDSSEEEGSTEYDDAGSAFRHMYQIAHDLKILFPSK